MGKRGSARLLDLVAVALLGTAPVACGTLLGVSDDPAGMNGADATGEGAATDAGSESGDGATPDGGADAGDSGIPAQQFFTNFDPPNANAPFGWDKQVPGGGAAAVGTLQFVSSPNSFHIDAQGSNFLERAIDMRAKALSVVLSLEVEHSPLVGATGVDILGIACGLGAVFVDVQLVVGDGVNMGSGSNSTPTKTISPGAFHTVAFVLTRNVGAFWYQLSIDGTPLGSLTGTCFAPMVLRVGASYTGSQAPTTVGDQYVFDLDDIAVEVGF